MQNWNQWQVPAGTVSAPMPPTPAGFTAPGADPMAMMQSYMQYYNQPAPSGYTAEQWAAAQQQNWAQWQQWQQQFQQWQAQYGEKYQETMKQLSAQGLTLPNVTQAPPLPSSQPLPPLPKEENTKPPLPPDTNNPYQYANMPPPHQNNLPLFPTKSQGSDYNSGDVRTYTQAPPLPPGQPPQPIPNPHEPPSVNLLGEKRGNNEPVDFGSAKKSKIDDDELTEAEKTFDAQFKQWEEQFNKWKQQNANHPDKTQYKQYEAKWTSWREKLIERREQMRKKREQQKQTTKADSEKGKNILGGDKILNILSSSENQGLINNLLGIGKTLGLTGKQETEKASTSSTNTNSATAMPLMQQPQTSQPTAMVAPTMTSDMTQAAWAAQQWAAQYNASMGVQNYGGFQLVPGVPPPAIPGASAQPTGNNFSQPPPNLSNPGMNFSQPPPGFSTGDSRQISDSGLKPNQRSLLERSPSLFGADGDKRDNFSGSDAFSQGVDHFQSGDNRSSDRNSDRFGPSDHGGSGNQLGSSNYRFGRDTPKNEFGISNRAGGNQFGSENERFNQSSDRFGGNRPGDFGTTERGGPGNQFRPENDSFSSRNDRFRPESDRFGNNKEGDFENTRFSRDNDSFPDSNDRFGPNDRPGLDINRLGRNPSNFGPGNDRFGLGNDRLGPDNDRFTSNIDRFGSSLLNDQFGPGSKDRFGLGKDRFGPSNNMLGPNNKRLGSGNERFDPGNNRFGPVGGKDNFNKSHGLNSEIFGSGDDRLNHNDRPDISDSFGAKDLNYMGDNRRDSFGDNSRGLNRNVRPFEDSDSIAPELKKLMEKRRAAMDVFKPRDDVFNPVKQDNIGSLSESFKKITGESPYASRSPSDAGPKGLIGLGSRNQDNMSRGPGDFGPRGPEFHSNNNFNQQPSRGMEFGSFGPPGQDKFRVRGDFGGPRTEFGPPRGLGNFGPSRRGDFEFGIEGDRILNDQSTDLASKNNNGSNNVKQPQGFDTPIKNRSQMDQTEASMQPGAAINRDQASQKNDKPQSDSSLNNILPLERPPWMDAEFSVPNSNENIDGAKGDPPLQTGSISIEQESSDKTTTAEKEKTSVSIIENTASENNTQESRTSIENLHPKGSEKPGQSLEKRDRDRKEQNTLPFMGENDPKPEDLNMEPPPELPNLGPVTETPNLPAFRSNIQDSERPPRSITQRGPNSPYFDAQSSSSVPFRTGGSDIDHQFGPRGSNVDRQFGPRGPNMDHQFGPRGPNVDHQFGPRGPNIDHQFGARGPNIDHQFGPRGANINRLELKAPNERQFGPNDNSFGSRGLDFDQRGPNDIPFNPRGLNGPPFGSRGFGDGQFGPRGPSPFGPQGIHDNHSNMLPQRLLNDGLLGPRPNEEQFGPMGRGFPPPRGPGHNQFDQRPLNNPPFPMQGRPNEGQFRPRGPNENNYGTRAQNDSQKSAIPSLLGLQFDKQPNFDPPNISGNVLNQTNKDFAPSGINLEVNKLIDIRRPFGVNEPDRESPFAVDQRLHFGPGVPFPQGRLLGPEQRPEQRPSFERDISGNAGHRSPFMPGGLVANEQRPFIRQSGPPVNAPHSQAGPPPPFIQSGPRPAGENTPMGQGSAGNFDQRMESSITDPRPGFGQGGPGNLDQKLSRNQEQRSDFDHNLRGDDQHSLFSEARKLIKEPLAGSMDNKSSFDSGYHDRSRDSVDCRRTQQNLAVEEFRVGKQFNYNHGGSSTDKKISEIIPAKVIDYGHTTKVTVHEYITPAQCFDYGHGHLKPVVPEHEVVPQRDFRHWQDTEQSLKEYNDRLRLYARGHDWQSPAKLRDNYKFERPDSRERDYSKMEKKPFESEDRRPTEKDSRARRDRDNKEERKERERDRERAREDREREYGRDLDREERSRRDGNDNRDKNREKADKTKTDHNKEYNRDDDRSKGNISRQEYQNKSNANTSSTQEPSISEPQNDPTETTSKKMELPRMPNYTMVDDILFQPGRQNRPPKIVIILRGPPGSGKSFVAKLIKDKEVEQGGSAPRILSLDDYFLVEKEIETKDDNGKKVVVKEMAYEYEEAMEQSYLTSLVKAFKKNITDGYFNFIILDCINEKISDYEEMWSFAKTKGFQVYVCEMEMDVHICMKRNIHNRTEEEINKIVDYFEPTPNHHLKLDVNAMLQEEAIDEVHMEDSQQSPEATTAQGNEDSQDSQEDKVGVSKWEQMDADNKLDRLDGLAKKKTESRPQTMEDFLQVPDYYNMEDTSGKKRVRWADLEERKEQEKLRAVGFVVGHTNWDRMMDPTKGQSALTRTKYI